MNYQQQLTIWDEWIKQGQALQVRALCRKLNHKKIPRAYLVDYAQIARRVGAAELIVLWLSPIVRSEKALATPATDSEKAIYALALLRLGAFREAKQILSSIDPGKDPQVYFYRASLNMNQWNYDRAIPDLKRYIQQKEIPLYSRLVGRLNLCASLVSNKNWTQADLEISKLMRILQKNKIQLLSGNLLEIRSQMHYDQNNPADALKDLQQAAIILQKADERSRLYIEKWRLINEMKESQKPLSFINQFAELKIKASKIKDWETCRDCDLQQARILKNEELMSRVFWGSQFLGYKKRILNLFSDLQPGSDFVWQHDTKSNNDSLDLVTAAPTYILRKLFFILTREMYQPLRTTEILDQLFPQEYYNPITSPAKLHRLIARARHWLQVEQIPVGIESFGQAFKLVFLSPCNLLLRKDFPLAQVLQLPQVTRQDFFKAKDWAQELSISLRTARHQIQLLVEKGLVQSFIRGPNTKYRLK